jgi:MtrB/PioB family decaheme-associated outer membrane protein
MNTKRTTLSNAIRAGLIARSIAASMLAATLASGSALAQDEFSLEGDEPAKNTEALYEEQTEIKSWIEAGLGYVSDDSFRFGRYTGLEEDGVFGVLNFDIFKRGAWDSDDATYWRFEGDNLGLDSRTARFEYGRQGQFSAFIGYDQTPHYQSETTQTIFVNPGSTNLQLPSNWVPGQSTAPMTQLTSSLRPFDFEHERRRVDLGFAWIPRASWKLDTQYSREEKDGNKTIGLTIGNTGGNPRAVLAPEPVDYRTQTADIGLSYVAPQYQVRFGYYMSLFDNDNDALAWRNPFSAITGWDSSAGFPNGLGQMHLEPDNEFHQLSASGGWNFSNRTRLIGDISFGRATQDETFLPYTINPVLAASITQALPRSSLDGEVESTYASLRFTSRPWDNFWYGAQFRYDDRDNLTPHDEYVYIPGDSARQNTAANSSFRRFNEPKSQKEQTFKLDASWRALDWLRIAGEAQFKSVDRERSEREEIDEDRYMLSFTNSAPGLINGGMRFSAAERDGGSEYLGYETFIGGYAPGYTSTVLPFVGGFPFENLPGMRKFNQADRDRRQAEVFGNLTLGEDLVFGLNVDYSEDDYDNSQFGLTFARVNGHTLDMTWIASDATAIYGFYTVERFKYDQDGRQYQGGAVRAAQSADPNRNWTTRSRDDVATYGLGFNSRFMEDKLKVGADFVTARSRTDVLTTTGPALTFLPLPSVETDLATLSIYGDYAWREDLSLRTQLAYEDYESSDWAIDGVPPNQLANVILLGEDSPDYNIWLVSFSVTYRF